MKTRIKWRLTHHQISVELQIYSVDKAASLMTSFLVTSCLSQPSRISHLFFLTDHINTFTPFSHWVSIPADRLLVYMWIYRIPAAGFPLNSVIRRGSQCQTHTSPPRPEPRFRNLTVQAEGTIRRWVAAPDGKEWGVILERFPKDLLSDWQTRVINQTPQIRHIGAWNITFSTGLNERISQTFFKDFADNLGRDQEPGLICDSLWCIDGVPLMWTICQWRRIFSSAQNKSLDPKRCQKM